MSEWGLEPPVFRPPAEADSLIVPATVGCSHNRCTFCSMYRGKQFRVLPLEGIRAAVRQARATIGPGVRRVFLADGNAFCLSPDRLREILQLLRETFPGLQRVAAYANARDVRAKSPAELATLAMDGLGMLYLGLESGHPEVLRRVDKGATPDQMVEAVQLAHDAGMKTSVMVLIGLAGQSDSLAHAQASAETVNRMAPTHTALLTYTPTPGSPLHDEVRQGRHLLPDAAGMVREARVFLAGLTCRTYFTCNHASNHVPLEGRLPAARERLLAELDAALDGRRPLRPEWSRGL